MSKPPLPYFSRSFISLLTLIALLTQSSLIQALAQPTGHDRIGISSPLGRLHLQLAPNVTLSGPDLYLVIYNQGLAPLQVKMKAEAPVFLHINCTPPELTLKPNKCKKVLVSIAAEPWAIPGNYTVTIIARAIRPPRNKTTVSVAVAQPLKIIITGQTAEIIVKAIDPQNQIVPFSMLRLVKNSQLQTYSVLEQEGGIIRTTVAPGNYTVYAYLNGETLAKRQITVSPGERKVISLILKTVYFEYISVIQISDLLQTVITLKNLYRPLPNATLIMEVSRDGYKVATVRVAAYDLLPVGRTENLATYTSPSGLKPGKYTIELTLFSNGQAVAAAKTHVTVKAEPQASVMPLIVLAAIATLFPFMQKYIRECKKTSHAQGKTAGTSQSQKICKNL